MGTLNPREAGTLPGSTTSGRLRALGTRVHSASAGGSLREDGLHRVPILMAGICGKEAAPQVNPEDAPPFFLNLANNLDSNSF